MPLGVPSGGNFTLGLAGSTSDPIPHNATPGQVAAAAYSLESIQNLRWKELEYMNVTLSMQKDDVFGSHAPKEDTIKAVKLTKDNLRSVGAYILTVLGGPVSVSDIVTVGDLGLVSTFTVGDWVVEEFDYLHGVASFRAATLDERKKYDLR